jgi:small nuclear ribonucleoprotein
MEGPGAFLAQFVDRKVLVRLKDARTLEGKLLGYDEHLNLVMDETVEENGESGRRLGRVVVRGNNVLALNAPQGSGPVA